MAFGIYYFCFLICLAIFLLSAFCFHNLFRLLFSAFPFQFLKLA
jgi:hypothetical protein